MLRVSVMFGVWQAGLGDDVWKVGVRGERRIKGER